MQTVCPYCGSNKVRKSSAHAGDGLGRLLLATSMRCHSCKQRFWVRSTAKPVIIGILVIVGIGLAALESFWQSSHFSLNQPSRNEALFEQAKSGDVAAELEIGMRYAQGDGFIKNPKEAANWLNKAARHGSAEAQYELGQALLNGSGVVQDYNTAFMWIEKAADSGYPPAQYSLGDLYRFGTGVETDKAKAYLWYNLAAAQGIEEAIKARDSVAATLKSAELLAMQALARKMSRQPLKPETADNSNANSASGANASPSK
jgi:hypothetical protein